MTSGIYKITNSTNGRFYIGSSANIEERFKKHLRLLRKGTHENKYLLNDFNKTNGLLTYTILEEIKDEPTRLQRETQIITEYHDNQNTCYNINKTAFLTGRVKTEDGLRNIRNAASKTAKRLWQSQEFREKRKFLFETTTWRANTVSASKKANSKTWNVSLVHDDGTREFVESNLSDFCRKFGLSHSGVSGLIKGKYKVVDGWKVESDTTMPILVQDSCGNVYAVGSNKSKFCRENGINGLSHFCAMLKGKHKSCEGWVLNSNNLRTGHEARVTSSCL